MFQYSNTSLLFALFFPVNPLFSDKPMVISCVTTEDRISLVPQGSTEVRVATKQSSTTSKETSSAIRKNITCITLTTHSTNFKHIPKAFQENQFVFYLQKNRWPCWKNHQASNKPGKPRKPTAKGDTWDGYPPKFPYPFIDGFSTINHPF